MVWCGHCRWRKRYFGLALAFSFILISYFWFSSTRGPSDVAKASCGRAGHGRNVNLKATQCQEAQLWVHSAGPWPSLTDERASENVGKATKSTPPLPSAHGLLRVTNKRMEVADWKAGSSHECVDHVRPETCLSHVWALGGGQWSLFIPRHLQTCPSSPHNQVGLCSTWRKGESLTLWVLLYFFTNKHKKIMWAADGFKKGNNKKEWTRCRRSVSGSEPGRHHLGQPAVTGSSDQGHGLQVALLALFCLVWPMCVMRLASVFITANRYVWVFSKVSAGQI